MSITIRPTTLADIAAVGAVFERAYPKLLASAYPAEVLDAALPIIVKAQPNLLECGTFYVAEEAGTVLGAGGWTRDVKDATLGHVRHVATDDRHVRRGIGRRLIEHCFAQARIAGVTQMECWSTLSAEPFYQSFGFEIVGPMDVTLEGGVSFPSLRMRLSLV